MTRGNTIVVGFITTLRNIPETFDGTNALDGSGISITRVDDVDNAVSFTLNPVFDGSNLGHICAESISPAGDVTVDN